MINHVQLLITLNNDEGYNVGRLIFSIKKITLFQISPGNH